MGGGNRRSDKEKFCNDLNEVKTPKMSERPLKTLKDFPTSKLKGVSLDVWAHIKREAAPAAGKASENPHDVSWTLITFDVSVRGTTIKSGEIAFQLDMNELFGAAASKKKWERSCARRCRTPPKRMPENRGPSHLPRHSSGHNNSIYDNADLDLEKWHESGTH